MTDILEPAKDSVKSTPALLHLSLLLIAIFLIALDPIFTRLVENELGPNGTVFNRELIAGLVFLCWQGIKMILDSQYSDLPASENSEPITVKTVLTFLLGIVLGELCLVTWALSLTQTSVANSNLLHNLPSVFSVLGGWLFLGQRFNRQFIIGMVIAIGGAIAVGIQDLQIAPENFVGDAWALFSAIVYAGYFLITEKLRDRFSVLTINLWYTMLASLILFPFVFFWENQIFPTSLTGWINVIALALLSQVIASVILIYELKQFSSGFVSLFMLLQPILTALLAWIVFQQPLNFLNAIAFIVVLLGIYLAQSGEVVKNSVETLSQNISTEEEVGG